MEFNPVYRERRIRYTIIWIRQKRLKLKMNLEVDKSFEDEGYQPNSEDKLDLKEFKKQQERIIKLKCIK